MFFLDAETTTIASTTIMTKKFPFLSKKELTDYHCSSTSIYADHSTSIGRLACVKIVKEATHQGANVNGELVANTTKRLTTRLLIIKLYYGPYTHHHSVTSCWLLSSILVKYSFVPSRHCNIFTFPCTVADTSKPLRKSNFALQSPTTRSIVDPWPRWA